MSDFGMSWCQAGEEGNGPKAGVPSCRLLRPLALSSQMASCPSLKSSKPGTLCVCWASRCLTCTPARPGHSPSARSFPGHGEPAPGPLPLPWGSGTGLELLGTSVPPRGGVSAPGCLHGDRLAGWGLQDLYSLGGAFARGAPSETTPGTSPLCLPPGSGCLQLCPVLRGVPAAGAQHA